MGFTWGLRAASGAVLTGAPLFAFAAPASADRVRDGQWPLPAFDAQETWEMSKGAGVTVVALDTGIDTDHPDLKGQVLKGRSLADDSNGLTDEDGHGTGIASIIAGRGHGPGNAQGIMDPVPEAKILPEKDHHTGEGEYGSLGEAIQYAADHGADVINLSQIVPSSYNENAAAVAYAQQHDVTVVAGTGNDGDSEKNHPAACPGVVAVSAVYETGAVWEDSNYGHAILLAPGVRIPVANTDSPYGRMNGTSAATAYVPAAAALVRAKIPDLTAGQVINQLVESAGMPEHMQDVKRPDEKHGSGFVQPWAALHRNIPAGPEKGPLPQQSVPSSSGPTIGDEQASSEQNTSGFPSTLTAGAMVAGLAVLGVVIVLVVKRNRRDGHPPGRMTAVRVLPRPRTSPTRASPLGRRRTPTHNRLSNSRTEWGRLPGRLWNPQEGTTGDERTLQD